MFVQLSDTLPCETLHSAAASCNQPARLGILRLLETIADVNYTVSPICPACIVALGALAGDTPKSEAISAETIKQVLAQRLGIEGAEETLAALRAAGTPAALRAAGTPEDDDGDD